MKTYNKYILSLLASFMLLSCSDDFLDRPDLINPDSQNFYQTETDAMQALMSVYDGIQSQAHATTWAPVLTVSDVLSDHAFAGGSDANDGFNYQQLNTFNTPAENPQTGTIWKKNYVGVYRANLFLEKIEGIDASDDFKARTSAEAKFCRAYSYFELLRFFENIPFMTETVKGSDYNMPQADPEVVYNQVALDLYEASQDLPEVIAADETGRLSKWAAKSLLARVFLFYNGVYGKDLIAGDVTLNKAAVLAELEDVIANSGHDLLDDYAMLFRLESEYSIESVFEIGYGDSPGWGDWGYIPGGEGNLAAQLQGPRAGGGGDWNRGWSYAPVSYKVVEAFDPADVRLEATILNESEINTTVDHGFQHTTYFSQKYTSDKEHWGTDGSLELNRKTNFRVIRFADVLLMAAELGSPNAQDYLDRVRTRAGVPSIPATADNIYNERSLELALEGLRYFDLLRKGLTYAESELTQVGERGPLYEGEQVNFDVTFDVATRGFLPIPQDALDLSNGNFTQNDGY
ncbi:Starch-binding associating with outer membrane [Reichenbachiella agariperforans]|uniref:Starch-binding associating with outer membrane n=1 Tax=Reichenbachiella agariperforans TaxID=156994 RepID=A0A1M6Q0H7_REIAG|nr:RagB/SusD family nutrient uptake outer membrane protein [Reichenbachiella agariperforans]SHK13708.1 Starch-binding associating with outer membrane [Reichenbachiella agariperforans]